MIRPSWDAFYLAGAQWAATRADCRRSKVGAILVSRHHRILGQGFNGTVPGIPGCLEGNCPRGLKSYDDVPADSDYSDCISTHAERNAIEDAMHKGIPASELQASTLYCTREPCPACRTLINSAGISRVVVGGLTLV